MSDEVVYTSKIRVERIRGPLRYAYLPHVEGAVPFGVHSEVAEHYHTDMSQHDPNATTLDYLIAAAAG